MLEKVKLIKNADKPDSSSEKSEKKKPVNETIQFNNEDLIEIKRAIDFALSGDFYKKSKKERTRLDKIRSKILEFLESITYTRPSLDTATSLGSLN